MKKETVALAMSGGVDSSVAACLLLEQGYEVIGITMKLLEDENTQQAIKDAKSVCDIIGIKHYVVDLKKEFKEIVIQNFITSYQEGKTPNPCIVCNKYFKFGLFYEQAKKLGATKIATGHYAIIKDNKLMKSEVENKDQSYFLYGIDKEILPYIIFPLTPYPNKEEIRKIARNYQLPISEKKDSQEVCFVPNDDYKTFLKNSNLTNNNHPGNICLEDGSIIGKHNGLVNYTIGQRKGLNIAYKEPLYVLKIDVTENKLIVGPNDSLFQKKLIAKSINQLEQLPKNCLAKVRSRGKLEEVELSFLESNTLLVSFNQPQRAITPGQSIVFYNSKNVCLGGAIIEEVK